jgi:hypothetical protein
MCTLFSASMVAVIVAAHTSANKVYVGFAYTNGLSFKGIKSQAKTLRIGAKPKPTGDAKSEEPKLK